MEFTTVPTVMHTHMLSSWGAEMLSVTIVVAVSSVDVPGMSATIGGIEVRTSEVEVVTVRITGIDAEVPVTCLPVEGTVEVAGCDKGIPLPVEQNITQIEVATLPVDAKHIVAARHAHQIIEVDFITSLVAGLLETHCAGRDCYCQHRHQGHQHLLHNRIFLTVRHSILNFTVQRNDFFGSEAKDFP
jgi:hypothetical protein